MRSTMLHFGFAAIAFLTILHCSRPALADVAITGTVGELAAVGPNAAGNNLGQPIFRFKMTNVALTQGCGTVAGYAWFYATNGDSLYREWYAALLVSKKGSTITCAVDNNVGQCRVTSCTLP